MKRAINSVSEDTILEQVIPHEYTLVGNYLRWEVTSETCVETHYFDKP